MTVTETIRDAQRRARGDAYGPAEASEDVRTLTSLLGNVNSELRERELNYKKVLLSFYSEEKTANRAKLRAETSDEFMRWREANDLKSETVELIRSLKSFIRSQSEEMRMSGGM